MRGISHTLYIVSFIAHNCAGKYWWLLLIFSPNTFTYRECVLGNMYRQVRFWQHEEKLNRGAKLKAGKPGEEVIVEVSRVALVGKKKRTDLRYDGEVIYKDFKKSISNVLGGIPFLVFIFHH